MRDVKIPVIFEVTQFLFNCVILRYFSEFINFIILGVTRANQFSFEVHTFVKYYILI